MKRKSRAGTYAKRRYRRGLKSWHSENRRLFAAYFGPFIVAGVVGGVLTHQVIAWSAGVLTGAFITMWIAFREAPPRYVEKWRDGAEGERMGRKGAAPA